MVKVTRRERSPVSVEQVAFMHLVLCTVLYALGRRRVFSYNIIRKVFGRMKEEGIQLPVNLCISEK